MFKFENITVSCCYNSRINNNILSLLLLAVVTPIVASLIQLAISRSREYIADAGGAKILKDSSGLASALEKIESSVKNHPLIATPKADATNRARSM